MKIHILDDWFDTLRTLPSFAKLDGYDVTVWNDHVEDVKVLSERLKEAEVLVLFRERTKVTAELLAELPNLKLISQRSGYPHIDVAACTANGTMLCSNTSSDMPSVAAAELTLTLMLAAARQLPAQMASLKAGTWQAGVGQSMRGRTLGLYGYGRIGRQVAEYAKCLGMKVQWWGSEDGRSRAASDGESVPASREDFFATSDFVSLHIRLKPATHGIITRDDLLKMKPTAYFINTSRAELVESGALVSALDAGRPLGAAVDVFEKEPVTDPNDPTVSHPKIIGTPHIGFVTEDELDGQFSDIYDQINAYADGSPIHIVNPDVQAK